MQEYKKKTAQKGTQQNSAAPMQAKTNGIPNSVLTDVFAGRRKADSSMMGHSQNLAPSIAAKMSRAFGMDLTGMQVYQSDAMKDTGMQGMAQGNKVVLSSDVDLNTTAGQAVLGHEISHIHAQSEGVGMGHSGLYENAALEHQADTEGLLAAQGRSIYSDGMDAGIGMQYGLGMRGVEGLTPLSGGMSASAGAPMQAKKVSSEENANQRMLDFGMKRKPGLDKSGLSEKGLDELKTVQWEEDNKLMEYAKSLRIPSNIMKDMKQRSKKENVSLEDLKDKYYKGLVEAGKGKKNVGQYSHLAAQTKLDMISEYGPKGAGGHTREEMLADYDNRINQPAQNPYQELEDLIASKTAQKKKNESLPEERKKLREEFNGLSQTILGHSSIDVLVLTGQEFMDLTREDKLTEENLAKARELVDGWKNNPDEMAKKYKSQGEEQ